MRQTRIKTNSDHLNFSRKQNELVRQHFHAIPESVRGIIATHASAKTAISALPLNVQTTLQNWQLQDAYLEQIGSLNKNSHNLQEAAAVKVIEMCLIEQAVAGKLPLADNVNIYDVEKLVRSTGDLSSWLNQLEDWLSKKNLSEIGFEARSYRQEKNQIAEIIALGRQLIESGNFLEYYNIDFARVHGDSNDLIWDVTSLLARARPRSIINNIQKIHDPLAMSLLHLTSSSFVTSKDIVEDLFKTKNRSAAFFALDLGQTIIEKIGNAYERIPTNLVAADQIRERREHTLKSLYKKLFNEFLNSEAILDGSELIRLNDGFQFDRLPADNRSTNFLKIRSQAFSEVSFEWLSEEPSRFDSLAGVLANGKSGMNLALSLAGEGMRQKLIIAGSPLWIDCIKKIETQFSNQMRNRNERYRHQISNHYDLRDINGWVAFWSGVEVFQGGSLSNTLLPLISKCSKQFSNLWKPSATEHGMENSISYLAVILLYSAEFSGSLSPAIIKDVIDAMGPLSLNSFSNVGNWDALLRLLDRFPSVVEIQKLVENVILVEGIDPKFLKIVPNNLILNNSTWQARIQDLELRYADYFV